MALFKVVVEAYVASRELDRASLSGRILLHSAQPTAL